MNNITDFEIINGVLIKYKGTAPNVIIPEGVTEIGENAFYKCKSLVSATIPNGVTSIKNSAFCCCTLLENVTIPNSVKSIGYWAFRGCSSLTSIEVNPQNSSYKSIDGTLYSKDGKTLVQYAIGKSEKIFEIPNGVTSIGGSAFSDCFSLTSVTIPNSVTEIGNQAFWSCTSLTSVTIPNSVTEIGNQAFWNCTSLTSVTIPNSVTSIGMGAFSACSSLTSVEVDPQNSSYRSIDGNLYSKDGKTLIQYAIGKEDKAFVIPDGVTEIGICAFSWCESLTSVTAPDSVTEIGNDAFYGCEFLTSITIPNGATKIGNCAFRDCESLKSITVPNSVTKIGYRAFSGCESLTINCEASEKPDGWSEDWNPSNRPVNWGYNPTKIASNFEIVNGVLKKYKGGKVPNVVIPSEVIEILAGTFSGRKSLKNIIISEGVTKIGDWAFSECESLAGVTIPNSITEIGKNAFCRCTSLEKITVDPSNPSYKSMDGNLYSRDGKMLIQYAVGKKDKNFVIPDGVTTIGALAFHRCASLTSVTIPNSVTTIGEYAFYRCESLTSIIIPKGVSKIGISAFSWCESLTSVTVPDGVTEIGNSAFGRCVSLASVTIPNSVTTIGKYAFCGCESLGNLTVEPSNPSYKSIDGNLYSRDGKTLIQYAVGKKDKNFVIPEGVTTIGDWAFFKCESLASVTIPDSVTKIGNHAFYRCKSLTINCEAEKKPIGWNENWNSDNRPVNWGYKPGEQEKKGEDEKKYKEVGNVKPSPIENFKITSNGALTKYLGAEEIITIPEGVKRISAVAFYENYEAQNTVKHIILPKSLEVIEDGAFADLAVLEQIVIPKGVKAIGRVAFRGCESLTIYCEVNEPPKGWDTRKYSLWSAECPVVWGYKSK